MMYVVYWTGWSFSYIFEELFKNDDSGFLSLFFIIIMPFFTFIFFGGGFTFVTLNRTFLAYIEEADPILKKSRL